MSKSRTAGWALDAPTPDQLKEFFAQIGAKRITKDRLQDFLRGGVMVEEGEWFTFTTSGKSLNELCEENAELFYSPDDRWWRQGQQFADEKSEPREITMRITVVPDSFSKPHKRQLALLGKGEENPTVREEVDGIIQYYRVTGKRIFPDCYVRCSDISSDGRRVYVGYFDSGGLDVYSVWDGHGYYYLGLAASRKS